MNERAQVGIFSDLVRWIPKTKKTSEAEAERKEGGLPVFLLTTSLRGKERLAEKDLMKTQGLNQYSVKPKLREVNEPETTTSIDKLTPTMNSKHQPVN